MKLPPRDTCGRCNSKVRRFRVLGSRGAGYEVRVSRFGPRGHSTQRVGSSKPILKNYRLNVEPSGGFDVHKFLFSIKLAASPPAVRRRNTWNLRPIFHPPPPFSFPTSAFPLLHSALLPHCHFRILPSFRLPTSFTFPVKFAIHGKLLPMNFSQARSIR